MKRPRNMAPEVWDTLRSSGLPFELKDGTRHVLLTVAGQRVAVLNRTAHREDSRSKRLAKQTICAIRRIAENVASSG